MLQPYHQTTIQQSQHHVWEKVYKLIAKEVPFITEISLFLNLYGLFLLEIIMGIPSWGIPWYDDGESHSLGRLDGGQPMRTGTTDRPIGVWQACLHNRSE